MPHQNPRLVPIFDRHFTASSEAATEFYWVDEARVGYGFWSARLLCTGFKPEAISCIGYWPGGFRQVVEVRTSQDNQGKLWATFSAPIQSKVVLACELIEQNPQKNSFPNSAVLNTS